MSTSSHRRSFFVVAVALLASATLALDVEVAVNQTAVVAPKVNTTLVGEERCRYIDHSIMGDDYEVFKGLRQLILTDQGLNANDTTVKANLVELCGQMFINPDALLRKFLVELSGGNLTAPVYYGVTDSVSVRGAVLLTIVKSAKMVKILQLLNVKSGYIPPAVEFKTEYNETLKENVTTIVESSLDVAGTEEWKKFTEETLNVTKADFMDATLNIVFLPLKTADANGTNATEAAATTEVKAEVVAAAEVKAEAAAAPEVKPAGIVEEAKIKEAAIMLDVAPVQQQGASIIVAPVVEKQPEIIIGIVEDKKVEHAAAVQENKAEHAAAVQEKKAEVAAMIEEKKAEHAAAVLPNSAVVNIGIVDEKKPEAPAVVAAAQASQPVEIIEIKQEVKAAEEKKPEDAAMKAAIALEKELAAEQKPTALINVGSEKKIEPSGWYAPMLRRLNERSLIQINTNFPQPGVNAPTVIVAQPATEVPVQIIQTAPQPAAQPAAKPASHVEYVYSGLRPQVNGLVPHDNVEELPNDPNGVVIVKRPPLVFTPPAVEKVSVFHNLPGQASSTSQAPSAPAEVILGPVYGNAPAAPTVVNQFPAAPAINLAPNQFNAAGNQFLFTQSGLPTFGRGFGRPYMVGSSRFDEDAKSV